MIDDDFAARVREVSLARDLSVVLSEFERDGYARLGVLASEAILAPLRARADDLMEGRVVHEGLFFQHDSASGRYDDLTYGEGYQGPSRNYRKIDKLEKDPLFLAWLRNPAFEAVARAVVGSEVYLLRAMMMTKPAEGGTPLPWHQDAGLFWGVTREPKLQLWTALDDAPVEAGCVEAFPGTHQRGLATKTGGVVPADIAARADAESHVVRLPARAGEVILIHNLVWHRSGVNTTPNPRRGFSVCFVDKETRCTRKRRAPRQFLRVFG